MWWNNKKLEHNTQRLPPNTPVYSYHWIQLILSEKTFPRFNHGQDKSQFKWNFSNEIQNVIKKSVPAFRSIFFLTLEYNKNIIE